MKKPEKKEVNHSEDGECGCKYLEDNYLCEIENNAWNACNSVWNEYHNHVIGKLPNRDEIWQIINDVFESGLKIQDEEKRAIWFMCGFKVPLATAIHARIQEGIE